MKIFYSDKPIVSSDIGNPYSSIYDSKCTKLNLEDLFVLKLYDNEWDIQIE